MTLARKNILRYASTSANLYNFLGDTDFQSHVEVYNRAVNNSLQAHDDIFSFEVENVKLVDPSGVLDAMNSRTPLFVTFHTGSYNMLVALLLKRGYKLNILSDTDSVSNGDYNAVTDLYRTHYHNDCKCEMVNVEKEGAIFNIIRMLKSGRPTIAYLDGNKGIGGQTKLNENMLGVPFLKGMVKIRQGLPFIAFLTKAPLALVLNYREAGINYIRFYEPIECSQSERTVFCEYVMNVIFQRFGKHVTKYKDQWSNWLYVHNWANLNAFQNDTTSHSPETLLADGRTKLDFNAKRFCPLKLDNRHYLFDRLKYNLHEINEQNLSLFSHKTSSECRQEIINTLFKNDKEEMVNMLHKEILIEI